MNKSILDFTFHTQFQSPFHQPNMSSYTPSAADELLINAPFYHGFQTRAEAEPLIPAIEGRFLVRLIEEEQQFVSELTL